MYHLHRPGEAQGHNIGLSRLPRVNPLICPDPAILKELRQISTPAFTTSKFTTVDDLTLDYEGRIPSCYPVSPTCHVHFTSCQSRPSCGPEIPGPLSQMVPLYARLALDLRDY